MQNWKKYRQVAGHFVFWTGLFLLYLYVFNARFSITNSLIQAVILMVVLIPLTYFNITHLIPRYFEQKSKGLYITYLISIIILGTTLIMLFTELNLFNAYTDDGLHKFGESKNLGKMPDSLRKEILKIDSIYTEIQKRPGISLSDRRIPPDQKFGKPPVGFFNFRFSIMRWFIQLFQTAFIILFSTVYRISRIMDQKQKEALILESEKLTSELKFLKSQINPHFLFNALNNIYTLSIIKSEKTPDVVMRLSEMLKYIIYETETKEQVPLLKEIAYIENFIAVFKLKDSRIKENVTFEYDVPENLSIAPMILIPFIENAFKHSKIEDFKSSWINIELNYEDHELLFTVKNSIPTSKFEKDKVGGIGVNNVKRRLELIYPGKHELTIKTEGNIHFVIMKIIADHES